MRPERLERGLLLVVAVLVGAVLATTVHEVGVVQGRYDVGAPTWVEGSFGWPYLIAMGAVSLWALGVVALINRAAPKVSLLPAEQAGGIRRGVRDLIVVGVVAMWLGYGAGWASSWVAGPAVERSGAVRFRFVAPVSATVDLAATCVSVIGDGDVLAEVDTVAPGGPVVWARSRISRGLGPAFVPPQDPRTLMAPTSPPAYLDDYDWHTRAFAEDAGGGHMALTGQRYGGAVGPTIIDVEVTWTCEGQPATSY